jgi:hypothetical protein
MNKSFFRRVAAQMIWHLPLFLCCKRVQQENRIQSLGSEQSFAADLMKVRCRPDDAGSLHNLT